MATASSPVSDMLVTVKSREVQRGMLEEMRGSRANSARHFLAAAHLELVLADDYETAGMRDLAIRSRLSAASCFWRASRPEQARELFDAILEADPSRAEVIRELVAELEGAERPD